jgi:hypothetical protein
MTRQQHLAVALSHLSSAVSALQAAEARELRDRACELQTSTLAALAQKPAPSTPREA